MRSACGGMGPSGYGSSNACEYESSGASGYGCVAGSGYNCIGVLEYPCVAASGYEFADPCSYDADGCVWEVAGADENAGVCEDSVIMGSTYERVCASV